MSVKIPKCQNCGTAAFMYRCLVHNGWRCDACDICFVGEPPRAVIEEARK